MLIRSRLLAPTGLPLADPFIGRQTELSAIAAMLRAGESVALCGPGGIGKSALAAQLVADLSDDREAFPGGALWIACNHAEDLGELWATIARALFLEGVATEVDPEVARSNLRNLLSQRPRHLIALDHLAPELDLAVITETLALPDHTVPLLTMRSAPLAPDIRVVSPGGLAAADAHMLFARLATSADGVPPPRGLAALTRQIPLAVRWLAACVRLEQHGTLPTSGPRDPDRAVRNCFTKFVWPAITPAQRVSLVSLAVLAQGASVPRAALTALGATAEDIAAFRAREIVHDLPDDRLAVVPTARALLAEGWERLDAAIRDRQTAAAIAFWLDLAASRPGYAHTEALETDAAGLYGILDWALLHGADQAARTLARHIDYFAD